MGNSESTEQSPPGHDEERGSSAGVAADGGGEGSGDERGLSRAKSRLEELEAEPAPKPQTSLLEDLQVWWAELDLEAAAKDLLDDIEAAITGCRSLANVALMPGAAWQPDDARGTCNLCDEVFSFSRRRHHCRHCGLLFCAECAGQFMYLSQNKVKFKFRICSDCHDDHDTTAENIRENAAQSIESVAQVAKAVGRAARHKHRASTTGDAFPGGAIEAGAAPVAPDLPKTEQLRRALGMEEGEELSFDFGQPTLATTAALVATPDDPYEGFEGFGDDAIVQQDTPWWEDTFFDGSFEARSAMSEELGGGVELGGGSEDRIGGYLRSGLDRERFMAYNDDGGGSAFTALGQGGGGDGDDDDDDDEMSFAKMVAQAEASDMPNAAPEPEPQPSDLPEPVE